MSAQDRSFGLGCRSATDGVLRFEPILKLKARAANDVGLPLEAHQQTRFLQSPKLGHLALIEASTTLFLKVRASFRVYFVMPGSWTCSEVGRLLGSCFLQAQPA
ncbi:hypothetical protein ORS3428_27735 [Mesorhizobium sp. ORS 3428]|nr:hypothetical protein ORS3428_27735 [Mesorhizobium sp. ORS 3428]